MLKVDLDTRPDLRNEEQTQVNIPGDLVDSAKLFD